MASTKEGSSHSPTTGIDDSVTSTKTDGGENEKTVEFFMSIRDEVQALPPVLTPRSSSPGAYHEEGGPHRPSPAPIGDVEVGTMQAESTLVQAELAPDNFEDIMAERDALRQIIDSAQAATAVVPSTENGSDGGSIQEGGAMMANQITNQQQKPWHTRTFAIVCILAALALLGVILGVTLPGKDDIDSSSTSFWKSRQIGQTILGADPYDEFGEYIALSSDGSYLAVGGEEHGDFAGRVVVYQNSNDKHWNQLFQILGDTPGEESGRVALSGDASMLAISGIRATNGQGDEKAGRVRTFQLSLPQADQPEPSPETYYDRIPQVLEGSHTAHNYGGNVQFSADGTIMAVGSHGSRPQNTTNETEFGGVQVFQFTNSTSSWIPLGQELLGDNEADFFGVFTALSADGLVLAAGGYGSDANGAQSGILRVYKFDEESRLWEQLGQTFYGEDAGDEIGRSISLSSDGQILAFGGYRHGEDAGRVYVYKWSDDSAAWQLMGQPIDGVSPGDRLGRSVFLSGDGLVLAAGAYWNSEIADRAGHVRVFHWNNSSVNESWDQVGPPIPGTKGAWFGISIAMSRDGKTLAIGGPFHDDINGVAAGMVEVYSLP